MASRTVIVFGPTGGVGSAVARTAGELGAKVILAMRDTKKPIPGLDIEKEKQSSFERVQADLTKPDTVRDAVKTSGAKHAFIYLAHGMPDGMKSTIEALKSAGIELVVFLSSFTVQNDPRAIQPDEFISYIHAQVEISLEEVFGADRVVSVRAGCFASNTVQHKPELDKGEVKLYVPNAKIDNIVPEDIGRVCGTVLVKGPQDEQRAIYLYGPKIMSQADSVETLAKALGKSPKVVSINEQDALKMYVEERGYPEPIAKYMLGRYAMPQTGKFQLLGYSIEEEHLSNVQKYSGKEATTFEDWVQQNKQIFV